MAKERNGFVTNSSSSSFVLTFKDEADYEDFKERCEELDYKKVYKLINRCRKHNGVQEDEKETALNILYAYYGFDHKRKIMDDKFGHIKDWSERHTAENDYEKTEEFKKLMEEYLNTTKYPVKVEKLNESEIIVTGMIWDTNGGLVEWAIRNGFLETELRQWVNVVLNVG